MMWDGINLLETIIRNEEISSKLYFKISEKIDNDDMKKIILGFSEEEEKHRRIYISLLKSFKKKNNTRMDEEEEIYIKLLLNNNFFTKENIECLDIDSLINKYGVWELAEKIERDAIFYILELKEFYPDIVTEQIKIILKEERKHLATVLCYKVNFSR